MPGTAEKEPSVNPIGRKSGDQSVESGVTPDNQKGYGRLWRREGGHTINTDCSDQGDSTEVEAYPPASTENPLQMTSQNKIDSSTNTNTDVEIIR
ncbi:hypothetical protein T12_9163 [Trichinella patagoniensis]|uniref:Uncharacterized protein n=1 Tax=Trichinella patagoniensis TaxID=990121 RepID=A0A0V1AG86_9BILA|nr:hypothetical protein T12_9163 [Trichinella patagoniensis]